MFGLGVQEIAIIAIIGVVLFGGQRFASMGKDLGEGIRGFIKGIKDEQEKP